MTKIAIVIILPGLLLANLSASETLESSGKILGAKFKSSASAPHPLFVGEVEAQVSAALGDQHGVSKDRVEELHARLRPSFNALEKTKAGRVSHTGVRWMLHQHFATEHGWVMEGLERSSGALLNKTDGPTSILRERLPEYVETVLEAKFEDQGFSLADVVAMAVTLETLILDDGLNMVETAFRLNGLSPTAELTRAELGQVAYAYMMVFSLHLDPEHKGKFRQTQETLKEMFPEFGWPFGILALDAMEEHLLSLAEANPFEEGTGEARLYGFSDVAAVARRIGDRFGREQNLECMELKSALEDRDPTSTGRVPLLDFYQVGSVGDWVLAEEVEVLRKMGALDETSKQKGAQVLIPNYLHARSNCVEASPFYKVCCLNECEGLLRALEEEVQRPTASVEEIVDFVERTQTSSMDGSKVLDLALLDQLGEIAATQEHDEKDHGNEKEKDDEDSGEKKNSVGLHTRLFAEWLHFVFPRECPYPHLPEVAPTASASSWEELQDFVTEEKIQQMAEEKVKAQEALSQDPEHENELYRRATELLEKDGGLHSMWTWDEENYVSTKALVRGTRAEDSTAPGWVKFLRGKNWSSRDGVHIGFCVVMLVCWVRIMKDTFCHGGSLSKATNSVIDSHEDEEPKKV